MAAATMTNNPWFLHPLNVDLVLESILTGLDVDQKYDLLKYRLVCHKWNDIIVWKMNKSGRSFRMPIRYGSEVPQCIDRSEAEQWTKETLRREISTLTGTAGRLRFDSVLIDREFFLGWFILEWTHFLELHGKSIRHLKLKIRPEEFPKTIDRYRFVTVKDCEEVMSAGNLRKIFLSSPNLESLEFCVRFSGRSVMFPAGDIPQLQNLTKITIREPQGYSYSRTLLIEILSMTSNLTNLYLKPSSQLTIFASAMSAVQSKVKSLTSLQISHVDFPKSLLESNEGGWMHLSYLRLTTLEINSYEKGSIKWIRSMLILQRLTLVNLVLGNRKDDMSHDFYSWLSFPPIMHRLRTLELNLLKFRINQWIASYQTRFPVLESLSLTGRGNGDLWKWNDLSHLLPGVTGQGTSVKEFKLIGRRHGDDMARILQGVQDTFPKAESHFDD